MPAEWPDDRIATAGAYLLYRGHFVFAVGLARSGDRLAVIRLGGHREPGESGPQCAMRELLEEASVLAALVPPPATYWAEEVDGGWRLRPHGEWADAALLRDRHAPFVLARHRGGPQLSATYLAVTDQGPAPSAEVRGLLLLDLPAIQCVTARKATLGECVRAGGRAILREPLDPRLPLDPFSQLQWLPQLLALTPGWAMSALHQNDKVHGRLP